MMEKIYLKNGQEAYLDKKIDDNNFLVVPVMFYGGDDGEAYEDMGDAIVVSEIFKSVPIEKIQDDYINILDKIKTKNEALRTIEVELSRANNELRRIETQTTNIGKVIYNRSELKTAERITVFPKDGVMSYDMSEKNKKNLKISIEFNVINGEERAWASKYYGDSWGSGDFLDPDCGFVVNATDDEIIEITKERIKGKPKDFFNGHRLAQVPDTYLTSELIEIKSQYVDNQKNVKVEGLKKMIKNAQEELIKIDI